MGKRMGKRIAQVDLDADTAHERAKPYWTTLAALLVKERND